MQELSTGKSHRHPLPMFLVLVVALIAPDVGKFDDLCPFLGFGLDQFGGNSRGAKTGGVSHPATSLYKAHNFTRGPWFSSGKPSGAGPKRGRLIGSRRINR